MSEVEQERDRYKKEREEWEGEATDRPDENMADDVDVNGLKQRVKELEWRFRYSSGFTRGDYLFAASVMHAYVQLRSHPTMFEDQKKESGE